MKKTLVLLAIVTGAALLLYGATIGFQDWQLRTSTPGSPASGALRMWADNATGKFRCLNPAGVTCYFDSPAIPGNVVWSGSADPNGTATDVAPHNMTNATTPSPYVASGSAFYTGGAGFGPYHAFEGDPNTACILASGAFGSPVYLELDLGATGGTSLGSYAIQANNVPEPNRMPKFFTLQGSNDNSAWTTVDTQTNQISWGSAEKRTFTLGSASATWRYWKFVVTANNGDTSYTNFGEVFLYSVTTVFGGSVGDFYFRTDGGKKMYGPKAGSGTIWPLFGTMT